MNLQVDAGVLSELLDCDDHLFIRRAYWVLLGREPDPTGLANYMGQLRSGTSKLRILKELARSPEGTARGAPLLGPAIDSIGVTWEELRNAQGPAFLGCAYQALFGRDPDLDGQRSYFAQLRKGIPRVEVLAQLLESDEYKARMQRRQKSAVARRIELEVHRWHLSHLPVLGRLLGILLNVEGDSPKHRRLRRIEFLLRELTQNDGTRAT